MTTLLLIGGLLAVFAGILVALSALGVIGTERTQITRTLAVAQAAGPLPPSMIQEIDKPFGDRIVGPATDKLAGIARRFTPADWTARARNRLDIAGNPVGWDPERILAAKSAGALVFGGLALLMTVAFGWGFWGYVSTALLVVLGFFAPDLWLQHRGEKRTDEMRKALPDSMDLLSISVESGLAFDAAIAQVAAKTEGPLSEELQRTLQEIQLGSSRKQALRALAERSRVDDLNYFVAAVVQAEAFGIPIAEVLRVQAAEMRLKRTQRAEETAAKLPVKILFPLLFTILPATFIVIIGPAAIRIMDMFSRT